MAERTPKAKPAAAVPGLALPEAGEPAERPRVLVVDDDERNLLAVRTVLEDVAEIVEARSGEEALRHLLKGEFAVILLDVYMPGMDGYETAQIIRNRDQTKRIPIVFLSAVNKEAEHLMRGYSMGAVDYVFKPVDPIVLRSKVAVFVDLFAMTKEIQRKAKQEQALLDANLRANAERLRAEQELRRAEQRQAAIIQSLPIILYLEPLECEPRWPAFISGDLVAMTGYEYAHVAEHPTLWAERLHEEDRDRVLAALASRKETGRFSVEYRWQCADGSWKHFHDQAVLLRDGAGQPVEFAGTLTDVTERRSLESELVQARILTMTRRAAEQGSDLVGRLLAFARRQQLAPAAIEITALSGAVSDLLAHTLGGLVALDWRVAGKGLWSAFADQSQLELALMNLIINARDAMPDGGTIAIEAANRTIGSGTDGLAPGDYVVLTVTDTGCGISPAMLEQVMEPFFTTKEVGKGTGLGLSMVYGFAKQSGGAFRIESQVGTGTRAQIWLPRAPQVAPEQNDKADRRRTARVRPLRVLLVDDHDGVRTTTAALLRDLGHNVVEATDGAGVLSLLRADPDCCELLISDYAMPHVSGAEVIRQARAVKPGLPAIIITGYADAQSISRRPEDVLVLAKPFTADQLTGAIAASVPNARMKDEVELKRASAGA